MILPRRPHPWAVDVRQAREIQERFRNDVRLVNAIEVAEIGSVAGIDNGYVKRPDGYVAYAAVVVFSYPELTPLETVIGEAPVVFPYVPGYLTFREGPAILDALAKLAGEPDVLLFDGQGYAHPRRMGLATHMGVLLDHPTIGVAKSRLVGRFDEPAETFGAFSPLIDDDEIVGIALRTLPGKPPLFISPGNNLDVDTARLIVSTCCRDGQLLPIPTAAADDAVTAHTAPLRKRRPRSRTK
ncbi:MAG: endonuclease V [Thermomicrobiales bacterium]|nr:endonuclease V [Thermomicrobiales bacterium]